MKKCVYIDLELNELSEIIGYIKRSYERAIDQENKFLHKKEVKNIWIIPLFILKFQQTTLKN
jgi:hypothetical protein